MNHFIATTVITTTFLMAVTDAIAGNRGAVASSPKIEPEIILLVKDYRFKSALTQEKEETGRVLCGVRCNSLATDYLNLTEPGGWRLIKTTTNKELNVELQNPFMTGECICMVDEYRVFIDDLTKPTY